MRERLHITALKPILFEDFAERNVNTSLVGAIFIPIMKVSVILNKAQNIMVINEINTVCNQTEKESFNLKSYLILIVKYHVRF
jgi:hypothetical protein